MKVEKLNGINYSRNAFSGKNTQARAYAPNFTGAGAAILEPAQKVATNMKSVLKRLPAFLRGLDFLGIHNGELLNNTVTAIGTACVAPIFIVNNPLSKEDRNSRAYSAWRQPLSATITFTILNKINSTWNKFFDKMAVEGKIDRIDMSSAPPASFFEKQIQGEYQTEKLKFLTDPAHSQFKDEIPDYRAFKEKRLPELTKDYNRTIINQAKADKRYRQHDLSDLKNVDLIADTDINAKKIDTIDDILEKSNVPKESREKYLKSLDMTQSDYIRNDKNIFGAGNVSLEDFEQKLDERLKQINLEPKEIQGKNPKKRILAKLNIFAENKAKLDVLPNLENEARQTVENNLKKIKEIGVNLEESIYDAEHNIQKKSAKEIKAIKKNLIKKAEQQIEKLKRSYDDILSDMKIEKWFKSNAEKTLNVFKNTKLLLGIVVGICSTLITCPILNWVYPRFMEEFFPNLAHAKKAKTEGKAPVANSAAPAEGGKR